MTEEILIQKYLNNSLNADEKKAFYEKMQTDSDFAETVRRYQNDFFRFNFFGSFSYTTRRKISFAKQIFAYTSLGSAVILVLILMFNNFSLQKQIKLKDANLARLTEMQQKIQTLQDSIKSQKILILTYSQNNNEIKKQTDSLLKEIKIYKNQLNYYQSLFSANFRTMEQYELSLGSTARDNFGGVKILFPDTVCLNIKFSSALSVKWESSPTEKIKEIDLISALISKKYYPGGRVSEFNIPDVLPPGIYYLLIKTDYRVLTYKIKIL